MGLPGCIGALGLSADARDIAQEILGDFLFADYWAADRWDPTRVNPRITLAAAPEISAWPEERVRNAPLLNPSPGTQGRLSATAFGGRPGVFFSGNGFDFCRATLSPVIAAGSRLCVWTVGKWDAPPAGNFRRLWELARASDGNDVLSLVRDTVASGKHGWVARIADGVEVVRPLDNDTDPHVFRAILRSTATGKYGRDGVPIDGTLNGLTADPIGLLTLGNSSAGNTGSVSTIHRIVIAHDLGAPTTLPSEQQVDEIESYLSSLLPP